MKRRRNFLGSPLARWLRPVAVLLLRAFGWRAVGDRPSEPRYVMVAAPHTSNWDGILLILLAMELRIELYWLGKKELFPRPIGGLMRWFGGVPVDRRSPSDLAEQVAQAYRESENLVVVIPPEATRARAERWKTGFYRIAQAADVPVGMGFVDFATKTGGVGELFRLQGRLTGDPKDFESPGVQADLQHLRSFYEPKVGRFPERFGPIRF